MLNIMRSKTLFPVSAAILLALVLSLFGPNGAAFGAWLANWKVSHTTLAGDTFYPGQYAFSPNDQYIVYMVNHAGEVPSARDLYSYSLTQAQLTPLYIAPSSQHDLMSMRIAPDSSRVVFSLEQGSTRTLFSVPINGGQPVQLATLSMLGGFIIPIGITTDSQSVIYISNPTAINTRNLYSVPITGGAITQLTTIGTVGIDARLSPDGYFIVFQTGGTGITSQLYSIPTTGGTPVLLSGSMVDNGHVSTWALPETGNRVVFLADKTTDEKFELYSALVYGGDIQKLNDTLLANRDVSAFKISQTGAKVVYQADRDTDELKELFSVDVAGGNLVKLNAALQGAGEITDFAIDPGATYVAYRADATTDQQFELFFVPIGGGTVKAAYGSIVPGGNVSFFKLTASRVVFMGDLQVDEQVELYSRAYNSILVNKVSQEPLDANDDVHAFDFSTGGHVYYSAKLGSSTSVRLFSASVSGGQWFEISGAMIEGGWISSITPANISRRVVYAAFQDDLTKPGLYVSSAEQPLFLPLNQK